MITLGIKRARLQATLEERAHHQPLPREKAIVTAQDEQAYRVPGDGRSITLPKRMLPQKRKNDDTQISNKKQATPKHFLGKGQTKQTGNTTVHNFSNLHLTQNHINLLNKGLSFSPQYTFKTQDQLHILNQFDLFSLSLRNIYTRPSTSLEPTIPFNDVEKSDQFLYRPTKFLSSNNSKYKHTVITESRTTLL